MIANQSDPVDVAPSPELVTAWAALGILPLEQVPLWAAHWLAAGLDGDALRELAGLSGADTRAVRELMPGALAEVGVNTSGPHRSALLDTAAALELLRATRTAQDVYNNMLTEHVTPELHSRGVTGARGRYQLPSRDCWARIGFQKDSYSDASRVTQFRDQRGAARPRRVRPALATTASAQLDRRVSQAKRPRSGSTKENVYREGLIYRLGQ